MYFLEYFTSDSSVSTSTAYGLASGIAVCTVVEAFTVAHIIFGLIRCGMTWQLSTCGLMYRKVRLGHKEFQVVLPLMIVPI